MRDAGVTILLPVYNEESTIHSSIEEIKKVMLSIELEYEIVVVNDGSTDRTKSILDSEKGIRLINNAYNLGYGASLKTGIRAARYSWVLMLDADGTYPIKDIPRLLEYAPQYDMVVGARTGKNVHIPFSRKPAKWFISLLVNFMCEKKVEDVNSGFRLFKKELAINFMNFFPSGFSFTTTITLLAFNNQYTVKYVPVDYYKRAGKSTVSPIKDFIGFVALIFRIVIYFKPLRFFLTPGVLLILAGIAHGVYQVLALPTDLGQMPVLLVLVGIQICFLGVLADIIVKK